MHVEKIRAYCLSQTDASESFPSGPETLVYKVGGKIFCITSLDNPNSCNLKCDPEKAIEFRQMYHSVQPGFHMNKKHWNTVNYNEDLNDKKILEMIDHSYNLVVKSLTKTEQLQLKTKIN